MGTMLAQKKPLESIQRSQAINFVAEIFYDELQFILDRRLLDHTMVNCHGMNSRVKSRDVLSVSEQHVATTNAGKEYILLNLARNSIYHQLPELLFHPLVLSTPGMSNKAVSYTHLDVYKRQVQFSNARRFRKSISTFVI